MFGWPEAIGAFVDYEMPRILVVEICCYAGATEVRELLAIIRIPFADCVDIRQAWSVLT